MVPVEVIFYIIVYKLNFVCLYIDIFQSNLTDFKIHMIFTAISSTI